MVTESWLNDGITDAVVSISGYSLYRADRATRGGGVCIFLNDCLFTSFNIATVDLSLRGVEGLCLKVYNHAVCLVICCIYRPPNTNFTNDQQLFSELARLSDSHENLLIFGDFNMPDLNWTEGRNITTASSPSSQLMLELLNTTRLNQLIDEPTRYRNNQTPSTLDLILTTRSDLVFGLEYLSPLGKSDHITLCANVQLSFQHSPKKFSIQKTVINYDALNDQLGNVDWSTVLRHNTANDNWDEFVQILNSLINDSSRRIVVDSIPSKPWISQNLLEDLKRKRALWQRFRRSGLISDYRSHRAFSESLTEKITEARVSYERSIAESQDQKRYYKYIRTALSNKVSKVQIRNPNGTLCQGDEESAEAFSRSFSEAYSPDLHLSLPVMNPNCRNSFEVTCTEFTEHKIEAKIKGTKLSCSPGPDNISAVLLHRCSASLLRPLSLIMQQSFNTSSLPSMWKTAVVRPIYKKGDKLDPANYRPISLISIVAKIMESIIVDDLRGFIEDCSLIPEAQHGFYPGRSVTSNLLSCLSDWSRSVDCGEPIDVIYLDFSRAFDRVSRRLLVHKLDHLGIRGKLLEWISDFLSNREFVVRVADQYSVSQPVLSGVPQGSVLGPVLFVLFTSDIGLHLSSGVSSYADDTKIYGNPYSDDVNLQHDLNRIYKWCMIWNLPLNLSKCVVLHIGKTNPRLQYYINGVNIPLVNEHVDLGVTVTHNLSWSEHIAKIVKKANTRLYLLNKAFTNSSPETFCKLYKTFVRPVLEYANNVWYPVLIRDQKLLEAVQRRATRLKYGYHRPEYETRLSILKLPTLETRRVRGDMILTYKILHRTDSTLQGLFELREDTRLRGHSLTIRREEFRTPQRQYYFSVRVFHQWNSLPDSLVSCDSVGSFKRGYDFFMLN